MSLSFKSISVIGLGYIGLPTAAVLASRGVNVIGVDVNKNTVDTINEGKIHIIEPDLDIVVRSVVQTGNLRATTIPEPADAFLIAVPTPIQENNTPDLSYVEEAASAIAPVLEKGNLVVIESTAPVGTTEKLTAQLRNARPDLTFPNDSADHTDINIAHCPERVLPGYVLQELVSNDRIIGGLTKACSKRAVELYKIFVRGDCIITNARTAEMSKLTENSFRDVNIAYANELSVICDKLKINVWELIKLANRHPRVNILTPGPGVGGHCIAIDPWFIVDSCPDDAKLIHQARLTNNAKPYYVINKVIEHAEDFKSPIIVCLGLTYKADIDDLRESPALQIVSELAKKYGSKIFVVEPNIKELPEPLVHAGVELMPLDVALERASIIVSLVNHFEFSDIDKMHLTSKVVIDTHGII